MRTGHLKQTVSLKNWADTKAFIAALAKPIQPGNCLLLEGELGAGKTTMVKALVAALGITDDVSSPTFTLVNHYGEDPLIIHVDLYRLTSTQDLFTIDAQDILERRRAIKLIEWADKLAELTPDDFLKLDISFLPELGPEARQIALSATPGHQHLLPLT